MVDITSRMNRRELLDRIAQRAGVGADTAEHVVDARARPGAHPNIDLLLDAQTAGQGWRLVPLPA